MDKITYGINFCFCLLKNPPQQYKNSDKSNNTTIPERDNTTKTSFCVKQFEEHTRDAIELSVAFQLLQDSLTPHEKFPLNFLVAVEVGVGAAELPICSRTHNCSSDA